MVAGAHFSTDVIAGILLSLMLFEAARAVITKLRAKTAMEVNNMDDIRAKAKALVEQMTLEEKASL